MAALDTTEALACAEAQLAELSEFEREVLDVLRLEEDGVEVDQTGQRTLCELFGFANDVKDQLHRALRQLIKMGLVRQLDGSRNAMQSCKKLRFSQRRITYVAA